MMDGDDKTIIRPKRSSGLTGAGPIDVTIQAPGVSQKTMRFTRAFTVGRFESCDVQIDSEPVSRRHVEISPKQGVWHIRDLDSSNGTYISGRRVQQAEITAQTTVQLGTMGPYLRLEVSKPVEAKVEKPASDQSLTRIIRHYFESNEGEQVGDRTRMIRSAYQRTAKKQSRRYVSLIGVIGVVFLIFLAVGGYEYFRLQTEISEFETKMADLFYEIKNMELAIAGLPPEQSEKMRTKLSDMEVRYSQRFEEIVNRRGETILSRLGVVEKPMISEEDLQILRMARIFGEYEFFAPKDFANEVKAYIDKWRRSSRLSGAIARAQDNGYTHIVEEVMRAEYLPPQFFYLALQESDFKKEAVGPKTRYGIAKGIWQFIPGTAKQYGLRTGPLSEQRKFDPQDERFNFEKATRAAARYLRYIYTTEAQASGLLVMASYNWGENRVRKLIRKMPDNPRERNFWNLLKQHRIPKETYDYVLRIFSAAVIGENPGLFGFEFDKPLQDDGSL